ncbi:MAG: family 20 glycosylhydrolase, partial [Ruthenibacterium sp.]
MPIRIHLRGGDALREGLSLLCADYDFVLAETGLAVTVVQKDASPIYVTLKKDAAEIIYDRTIHFFRAFGLLLEALQQNKTEVSLCEIPQFTMNGPMFDVSQGNAVPRVETVQRLLRRMAMMGLDTLMLYCEDSYEVKSQPYFGYMRAKYTQEELRTCDDDAAALGIEMIPCIQTLAHLDEVLKWNVYADVREDAACLLVGEEKTYALLEALIDAATKPFRSRKIHIGMDEAMHLGRGTYLTRHGLEPTENIMQKHLTRVMQILRKKGLEPMMWSDMFFRTGAQNDYYDLHAPMRENLKEKIPTDISLVYWDYYHFEPHEYEAMIARHRQFSEPIFAGGIWTWTGFAANWGLTETTMRPALLTCKKMGIKRVIATVWGDNGTECGIDGALPGLSFFAEHGYIENPSDAHLASRFAFCCKGRYESFMAMREFDETPGCGKDNPAQVNPSKFLMWQDILTGLFDKNIAGLPLGKHYEALEKQFLPNEANAEYAVFDRLNYHAAHTLALKAELGIQITSAYRSNDRVA